LGDLENLLSYTYTAPDYVENPGLVYPTSGASANTKGSWTQIIASTTKKVVALSALIDMYGVNSLWDIGTGSAGSEVVLIANVPGTQYAMEVYHIPILIPAGTRVAVRGQASTASSTALVAVNFLEND